MNQLNLKPGNNKLSFDKQRISTLTAVAVQAANLADVPEPTTNISYIADCFSQIALNCPTLLTA